MNNSTRSRHACWLFHCYTNQIQILLERIYSLFMCAIAFIVGTKCHCIRWNCTRWMGDCVSQFFTYVYTICEWKNTAETVRHNILDLAPAFAVDIKPFHFHHKHHQHQHQRHYFHRHRPADTLEMHWNESAKITLHEIFDDDDDIILKYVFVQSRSQHMQQKTKWMWTMCQRRNRLR